MSASVGLYLATALFVTIGGDTEEAMWKQVWKDGADYCDYGNSGTSMRSLSESRRIIDVIPCELKPSSDTRDRGWFTFGEPNVPEDWPAWDLIDLDAPEWVISDQPTGFKRGYYWIKLQL